MDREQKDCLGMIAEDMEGQWIRGVPGEFDEVVILSIGTWWTTFGPANWSDELARLY